MSATQCTMYTDDEIPPISSASTSKEPKLVIRVESIKMNNVETLMKTYTLKVNTKSFGNRLIDFIRYRDIDKTGCLKHHFEVDKG